MGFWNAYFTGLFSLKIWTPWPFLLLIGLALVVGARAESPVLTTASTLVTAVAGVALIWFLICGCSYLEHRSRARRDAKKP